MKLELGNSKEQYLEIEILLNATKNRMIKNKAILSKYSADLKSEQIVDLEAKINKLKDDIIVYKKLVVAFGRNGIPSLIIEQTIPEIENITNEILSDLDIDMQLKLELQKELKSGGIADTLDIMIQSNKYTRSYFNYSGGERFLIDLSLRIALSTILLRRKGCNNSTLIIDEGLGSLDRTNREKVLKLISMLNEKFGFLKILIISHISEIQDSIGNKIYIRMKNGSSEVRNEL
jgi:exonuclease SbcC